VEAGVKVAADVVIGTERLLLRRMRLDDVDALFQVWGDAHAMRFYPAPLTREELLERVARNLERYAAPGHGLYTAELKSTGEILGDCGPTVQEVEGTPEIEVGYHFLLRYWGNGYATEAARAARDWAFNNLPCARVISLIRPVNVPSQRVAQRNGMSVVRRVIWRELEHDVWAIPRSDWQRQAAVAARGPVV
jgi:ribosomal-protein-alanine N-acetyltransferase